MKKVALLIPANLYFCPYVSIYTNILKEVGIEYDMLVWDKENRGDDADYVFKEISNSKESMLIKLIKYLSYSKFLKKVISEKKYDRLIVFGPQIGIFLQSFLRKKYNRTFILDYRDLSIDQIFKRRFEKLLSISSLNVISSPGFQNYLPQKFEYILSHNFDINIIKKMINSSIVYQAIPEKINVLTIGAIRDFKENVDIIDALANNDRFRLLFVGKGPESERISNYIINNDINNAKSVDFYKKEEEQGYINAAHFINIYYPRKPSHDSAISNRFYNSLIYGKPMIATSNTTQGNLVKEFNLGLAIDNTIDLDKKIINCLENTNFTEYNNARRKLMKFFIEDYQIFKQKLIENL